MEDTRAYGIDGRQTEEAIATTDPALLPPRRPKVQGEGETFPELTCAEAVTAFVASPLLPDSNQLKVDHISALLALAVDGPVHKAAIKLLAPAYS